VVQEYSNQGAVVRILDIGRTEVAYVVASSKSQKAIKFLTA